MKPLPMEPTVRTGERGAAAIDPMHPRLHTVDTVRRDTDDTFTLTLIPRTPADRLAEDAQPGQFNMLYAFGVGEVPISLSGDPGRPDRLVHTTREVGAVTRALGRLERGGTVGVRGPYGTAWPVREAEGRDVVLVAGGIGLAPLRPAILHLIRHRDRYRRVTVLIGARTPEELLYRDEADTWGARSDLDVRVTVDRAAPGWRGPVGFVTELIQGATFDPNTTVAMTCGPEPMMRAAARALHERGVPESRVWLSMERNMKCAIGHCGHCQMGPYFVCRDGPVFPLNRIGALLDVPEV